MTNNDILRRIRYIFDYSNPKMIEIFSLGGKNVSLEEIIGWLAKEESDAYLICPDHLLATFLNGFIVLNRGPHPGKQPIAEQKLTNNLILTKLKIALTFRAEDISDILKSEGLPMSKSELSALFRQKSHKHYRECGDQLLRKFLRGIQKKYRP